MMNDFYEDIRQQGQKAIQEAIEIEVKRKHLKKPNEYVIRIKTPKEGKIKEVKTLDQVIEEIRLFMDLDFVESISISKTFVTKSSS